MKPEKLVAQLKNVCSDRIESIVLYGSTPAGDRIEKRSNYNILIVTRDLTLDTLNALAPVLAKWKRAGNPSPLIFTQNALQDISDTFPIELLDLCECRKILLGSDVVANITVRADNLRPQILHELRGGMIKLRQRYLGTGGKPKAIIQVMIDSLSTFLVLFRATLRHFEKYVPVQKKIALDKLAKQIPFDSEVFKTVEQLKKGELNPKDVDARELFEQYLSAIDAVITAVADIKSHT
jgi:hypothetical protein